MRIIAIYMVLEKYTRAIHFDPYPTGMGETRIRLLNRDFCLAYYIAYGM